MGRVRPLLLVLLLFAATFAVAPVPAQGADWAPGALRSLAPDATSRGRSFDVTITFTAPPVQSALYLQEGLEGAAWYIPDDFDAFAVTLWSADPTPSFYNGKASWIWDPADYVAGQTIALTYEVTIATTVAYATYTVDAVVGRVVDGGVEEFPVAGEDVVDVAPPVVTVTPSQAAYQRTETLNVLVTVTYPEGTPVGDAVVSGVLNRTGESMVFTPLSTPGQFAASRVLGVDEETGPWTVTVTASDDLNNVGGGSAVFTVLPASLLVTVRFDRTLYFGGDDINVTAVVTYPDDTPVEGATAAARFLPADDLTLLDETAPGVYEGSYRLAPDASVGTWTVEVRADDGRGNEGVGVATFEVGFTTMALTAAVDRAVYNVLETVLLTAGLAAPDGTPVSGATVLAELNRTGEVLALDETTAGVYEASYALSAASPLGDWMANVTATLGDASASVDVTWTVVAATFDVSLALAPASVTRTLSVTIEAVVVDADAKPVVGADAVARFEGTGDAVPMNDLGDGRYVATYRVPPSAPLGSWNVTVDANRPSGGGRATATLLVAASLTPVALETDRMSYVVTDVIQVTFRPIYADGSLLAGGSGRVFVEDVQPLGVILTETSPGVYVAEVFVPPGTPLGDLTLTAVVDDAYGNSGTGMRTVRVELAVLSVEAFLARATVERLEAVDLTVKVSYPDGSPLVDATIVAGGADDPAVPAVTSTSDPLGTASFSWDIPPDAALGEHAIAVKATHPDGLGETTAAFDVLATTLDVGLSVPATAVAGDEVLIAATVRYGNGDVVLDATVRLTAPEANIDQVMDFNAGASRYEASVRVDATGDLVLRVEAEDPYGNAGAATGQLTVAPAPGADLTLTALVVGGVGGIAVIAVVLAWMFVRPRRKRPRGPM